jgi:ABC-2 type transport system permease protein
MLSALLYLQLQSMKNRLLLRFRRLKQPKYLLGGIVGAIYFYFYFFRYLFGLPRSRSQLSLNASPATLALYEALGASLLMVAVLLTWVLPHGRAALAFSEAEVAFLFPAPISRRGLIHFKLLRSQVAILFTTFFLMLVTRRFGGNIWMHAAGWWLILSTLNLHILGSSFARTMLLDRGISNWWRRLAILGVVLAACLGVIVWASRSIPSFNLSQMTDLNAMQEYIEQVLTSGPLPWLLYPFRLVVRPFLAPNGQAFIRALFPALALAAIHYWWVSRSDVAFEEASVEASKRIAQKLAAVRSGNIHAANSKIKGRRPPFVLGSTGSPATALLWKNLISAGQAFTVRLWLIVAASAVMACTFLVKSSENSNLESALGMAAGLLVIWSLFLGPQILRQDFRQDLPAADVLKMYPVRGWEIALGELLAPAAILTGLQLVLLLISSVLLWSAPISQLGRPATLAIGAGAALVVPVLNLIILQIPNAAVLLFPAWIQMGKDRAHGIELTGQRIIAIFGQLLVFVLTLIPAVVAFGAVFFASKLMFGQTVAIFTASVAAALILAAEAALGVVLLGRLFERFDVSSELPVS